PDSDPDTPPVTPLPTPTPTPDPATSETIIKALAIYTQSLNDIYSDTDLRIQHLFNVTNDILQTSGLDLEIELIHLEQVDYPDGFGMTTALDHITQVQHTAFSNVRVLRDQLAADLVVLFRPYANDGYCGYAWIGGYQTDGNFSNPVEPDYAYSAVAADCSDYTLVHEIGHNMGLAHSRREAPNGGSLPYGTGYGVANDFVTIMATASEFNAIQLPRLSSPALLCNAQACGVVSSNPTAGADAVQALTISKDQIADYRD
ncbi:MAG: M12 family metallo-peptidase, partial [Gammaproteobacteria bacterium]|nr:M12 family metallo-peptidase [Gammaproteobacteria bacterium]